MFVGKPFGFKGYNLNDFKIHNANIIMVIFSKNDIQSNPNLRNGKNSHKNW